jgi:hypothetical protein
MTDWATWHTAYDDPSSLLSVRLRIVQAHLSAALSQAPAGKISLVSLCAGQGRDVTGVLPSHPRREDVRAVLVEADPRNVATARRAAADGGLSQVEVREADAGPVAGYADALPADVLLLCGIFGNVSDSDIRRTVADVPALCRPGATVIWTRHRRAPDLTVQIRHWFTEAGLMEVAFDTVEVNTMIGVGVARAGRRVGGALPEGPLFTFGSARHR